MSPGRGHPESLQIPAKGRRERSKEEKGVKTCGLQTPDSQAGPAHLSCGVVHDFLGGEVTLVANQEFIDILTGVAIYLLQPLFHVSVGFLGIVSKVIEHPNPGLPRPREQGSFER